MKEYEFTLKFALPNAEADPESYIDALFEAGCNDALIGTGIKGRIGLDFDRESCDAMTAVLSAIKDVKKAIPDAKLLECSPDLVGISGIAKVLNVTRQAVQKMVIANIGTFPAPIHAGNTQMWHLYKVLEWSHKFNNKKLDSALFEIAETSLQVNVMKEFADLDKPVPQELTRFFNIQPAEFHLH